jgi:hypothetical protein
VWWAAVTAEVMLRLLSHIHGKKIMAVPQGGFVTSSSRTTFVYLDPSPIIIKGNSFTFYVL